MVLLRHLLGDALRRLRLRQGRTLREVSAVARVSLGYLSEVERGQKEASSELLAAICTALETPLSQVLREVSDNFALAELQQAPVLTGVREPSLTGIGGGRQSAGLGAPARMRTPDLGVRPGLEVPAAASFHEMALRIGDVEGVARRIGDVDGLGDVCDVTDMVPV